MWVLRPLFHVCAQPGDEFVESELVGLVKVGHKKVGLFGVRRQVQAVDGEKSIRGRESRPLGAIDKGMILRAQALPERGGFLALWLATSCLDDLTIIRDDLNAPHSAISLR